MDLGVLLGTGTPLLGLALLVVMALLPRLERPEDRR
jgi:hypothetical protein